METIFSIQIKTSVFCYETFYSLYVDNKLYKNYNSLKQAKKALLKLLQENK